MAQLLYKFIFLTLKHVLKSSLYCQFSHKQTASNQTFPFLTLSSPHNLPLRPGKRSKLFQQREWLQVYNNIIDRYIKQLCNDKIYRTYISGCENLDISILGEFKHGWLEVVWTCRHLYLTVLKHFTHLMLLGKMPPESTIVASVQSKKIPECP
jgi:hypothetical protein